MLKVDVFDFDFLSDPEFNVQNSQKDYDFDVVKTSSEIWVFKYKIEVF